MMTHCLALLVAMAMLVCGEAHLLFQCPQARSCFHGGYWGGDSDGAWRQKPCDRAPVEPTTVVQSGASMCLSLREFVPHPGYFRIRLATEAVGPNDDEPLWITLNDNIPQGTDGVTTGYQAFQVTLPSNVTCDHCTIQVMQWAEDLDWYYYACTDVKIVAEDPGADAQGACYAKEPEQCVWTPGPPGLRAKILQSIMLGSWGLFAVILLSGWVCFALRQRTATMPQTKQDEEPVGRWAAIKTGATHKGRARFALCLVVTACFVTLLATTLTIVGLRSCWGAE